MTRTSPRGVLAGVLLCGLAALAGCGGGRQALLRSNFVEFSPEQLQVIDSQKAREYEIQDGDILRVAFAYEKNLDQNDIVVLDDGAISLVGIDRVKVAGLTISEADSVITAAYAKEYRDPDLSVIVQETSGRRIYVLGEVREPGLRKVPASGLSVLGAIGVAGGFTDDAQRGSTVLVRVTETGYLVQQVDLGNFASVESAGLATLQLLPNDIVYVPRSTIGDFAYFAKTVVASLGQITRVASDIRYLSNPTAGRY